MGGVPAFSQTVATDTSRIFLAELHALTFAADAQLRWGECRKSFKVYATPSL